MKRSYFNNFFISLCGWAIGMAGYLTGNIYYQNSNAYTFLWIGYIVLSALGLFLLFRLYQKCVSLLRTTDNMMSDTILGVSMIAGFGALALLGILSDLLPYGTMFFAPIYALWNLIQYALK